MARRFAVANGDTLLGCRSVYRFGGAPLQSKSPDSVPTNKRHLHNPFETGLPLKLRPGEHGRRNCARDSVET